MHLGIKIALKVAHSAESISPKQVPLIWPFIRPVYLALIMSDVKKVIPLFTKLIGSIIMVLI